jgi:hypothetical protein
MIAGAVLLAVVLALRGATANWTSAFDTRSPRSTAAPAANPTRRPAIALTRRV